MFRVQAVTWPSLLLWLVLCSKSPVLQLLSGYFSRNRFRKSSHCSFVFIILSAVRPRGDTENQNTDNCHPGDRSTEPVQCCQLQWFMSHQPFMSLSLTLSNYQSQPSSFPTTMVDSKTSCGLGKWRPSWLQKCARKEANYLIWRPAVGPFIAVLFRSMLLCTPSLGSFKAWPSTISLLYSPPLRNSLELSQKRPPGSSRGTK